MPRKRNVDKASSHTTKSKGSTPNMEKTKVKSKNIGKKSAKPKVFAKSKKKQPKSQNLESDVLTQMKTKGYDSLIFCAPFVILIQ
jgi:hypothetical protein